MRYLSIWSFDGEEVDKVIERYQLLGKDREKNPDKYPKILYPDHSTVESWGGITVIEGTHVQLMNLRQFWGTMVDFEFIPVIESSKVAEMQLKALK
jgi:hypothetical protein